MKTLCYLNGQYLPLSEARISPFDRGFLFGDAIYEMLRVYEGKFFHPEAHFRRLSRSLDGLRIGANVQEISNAATELLKRSGLKEAALYIQVTRGVAEERRHAFPPAEVKPTVFMFVQPYDDAPNRAKREFGTKAVTFPEIRWGRVDLKTVNLLGNVLAAQAAKEADVYEAIFVKENGHVTEGSHTNIFSVINGTVRTYPLCTSVLPGVTRTILFNVAKGEGIQMREEPFLKEDLFKAEEVFLTATTAEIFPIVEIDGKRIASGQPGPVTRRLQSAFRREIEAAKNV